MKVATFTVSVPFSAPNAVSKIAGSVIAKRISDLLNADAPADMRGQITVTFEGIEDESASSEKPVSPSRREQPSESGAGPTCTCCNVPVAECRRAWATRIDEIDREYIDPDAWERGLYIDGEDARCGLREVGLIAAQLINALTRRDAEVERLTREQPSEGGISEEERAIVTRLIDAGARATAGPWILEGDGVYATEDVPGQWVRKPGEKWPVPAQRSRFCANVSGQGRAPERCPDEECAAIAEMLFLARQLVDSGLLQRLAPSAPAGLPKSQP